MASDDKKGSTSKAIAQASTEGTVPVSNDPEVERDTLATILIDPLAIHRVRTILKQPQDFFVEGHQAIYEAMLHLCDNGIPVDMNTVRSRLAATNKLEAVGGTMGLASLIRTRPVVDNITAYADRIASCARARNFADWARVVAMEANAVPDVIAYQEDKLRELSTMAYSGGGRGQVEHITRGINASVTAARQRALSDDGMVGTPTGYPGLDEKTGGMADGDMWIIAGRSGQGKTSAALSIARSISQPIHDRMPIEIPRRGVVIFELEMPEIQIADRLICMDTDIPFMSWRAGRIDPDYWGRALAAAESISKSYLFLEDTPGMSVFEMEAKLVALKSQFDKPATFAGCPLCQTELLYAMGIGRWYCPVHHPNPTSADAVTFERRRQLTREERITTVILDHIGLAKGDEAGRMRDNPEQQLGSMSRYWKAMAKRRSVSAVALCQVNRSVETRDSKDKRPRMSDLRGSGQLEQDADVILFPFRPGYYEPDNPKIQTDAEFIIAKQRNGGTCKIRMQYKPEVSRFDDPTAIRGWNDSRERYELPEYI